MQLRTYQWLGQMFGAITVVVSLLMVAWELRQNTRTVSAQAILELNVMTNAATLLVVENEQLSAVLVKGRADLESLSESELLQFNYYHYVVITGLEATHSFYSKGILDEVDYSSWGDTICGFITSSPGREVWEVQKYTFLNEFQTFVDTQC